MTISWEPGLVIPILLLTKADLFKWILEVVNLLGVLSIHYILYYFTIYHHF